MIIFTNLIIFDYKFYLKCLVLRSFENNRPHLSKYRTINCILTFPSASVQFNSHTNGPRVFAERDEPHFTGYKGQFEPLSHYQICVAVSR